MVTEQRKDRRRVVFTREHVTALHDVLAAARHAMDEHLEGIRSAEGRRACAQLTLARATGAVQNIEALVEGSEPRRLARNPDARAVTRSKANSL